MVSAPTTKPRAPLPQAAPAAAPAEPERTIGQHPAGLAETLALWLSLFQLPEFILESRVRSS